MNVELKPHTGVDLLNKRERRVDQYMIIVDGKLAGFIGYQDGAKPMMIERHSPLELKQIREEVERQLQGTQKVGEIQQPPCWQERPEPEMQPEAFE